MKRTAAANAAIAAALVVFAAAPASADNSNKAYDLATRLTDAMKRCWFNGDPTFAGYVVSPEPNATMGPRILVVPRQSPGDRPVMVVQISPSGDNVNVYGPLAGTAGPRVGGDLKRWIDGADSCR